MDINKVLTTIKPSDAEIRKNTALARKIINMIKTKFGFEAVLVGSMARGTALKGKSDLDIFILFPKNMGLKELEKSGLQVGRYISKQINAKMEVHYAQHPYVRLIKGKKRIEIVPAYKMSQGDRIKSAVDRTPLHNEYIKKKLKDRDSVLLLKWFMRQIGVYGAEIKTHGFSGYLTELLVVKYGSFKRVLEEASVWETPVVIDIEDQYCCNEEIIKKFSEPLIVIDPVDKNRNVASPVSTKNLAKFVLASRKYLETGELPKAGGRKTNGKNLIAVKWEIKPENDEIVWSQLEAFARRIVSNLENHGFIVKDAFWWTDATRSAELILDMDTWEISKVEKRTGPSVFDFSNSNKFVFKYNNVGVTDDGRVYSERGRKTYRADDLVKEVLRHSPKYLGTKYRMVDPKDTHVIREYKKSFWSW